MKCARHILNWQQVGACSVRVRDDVFAQSFSWTHHVQCCHRELQAQWPVGKSSPAVAGDIRNFFMMKRYEECINFHFSVRFGTLFFVNLRGVGDDS